MSESLPPHESVNPSVNPSTVLDAQSQDRAGRSPVRLLAAWVSGAALFFFLCSSVRHTLFLSGAFDLGIYDQVVYLMSQGLPPISSLLGFHHMGNHAAWAVYPLALLYKIYPSVYWLLAVQAMSLALGVVAVWLLARQAGLGRSLSLTMAIVYLLYPLIFNLNLFDFHPDVMALPAMLFAVWAARADRPAWFCVAILFALGCRDALSLTIAGMGIWLLLFEKRRFCGLFALAAGLGWFVLVTQWIIPLFKGSEVAAINRYDYLGHSVREIVLNFFLKPTLVLSKLFSLDSLRYVFVVLLPVLWGLSPRHLAPLVAALPSFILNILSQERTQRILQYQYSLPIVPFLLIAAIGSLAANQSWLRQRRWIILWSLVAFSLLQHNKFFSRQMQRASDSWDASRAAIALIQPQGGVLADDHLTPHITHRPIVRLARLRTLPQDLHDSQYVLINLRLYRGDERDMLKKVIAQVKINPDFQLRYQQDSVYLFTRR